LPVLTVLVGKDMSRNVSNSVAVLALALAFWAFFQASKQLPYLASSNPFAEDPYDAVGSFAIQAAGLLAALAVVRSFGYLTGGDRDRLLVRTQLASVLAVGITLAADAIALVRHGGDFVLVVLVVGLACLTAAVGWLCRRGVSGGSYRLALIVCAVAALVLFFYPEGTRSGLPGALVAIAAGIVVLFVPLRFLVTAMVPGETPRRRAEWWLLLPAALVTGMVVAIAESTEGGGAPRLLPVAAIFIGFEVAAAAVGYALLRGPLELTLRWAKDPGGPGRTALLGSTPRPDHDD
jgi:hypothetical protein